MASNSRTAGSPRTTALSGHTTPSPSPTSRLTKDVGYADISSARKQVSHGCSEQSLPRP